MQSTDEVSGAPSSPGDPRHADDNAGGTNGGETVPSGGTADTNVSEAASLEASTAATRCEPSPAATHREPHTATHGERSSPAAAHGEPHAAAPVDAGTTAAEVADAASNAPDAVATERAGDTAALSPPPSVQPEPPHIVAADDEAIARAVELLRAGDVVAFPTETVYGLGADASNAEAVRRIFKLKGRPADHPVIVHMPDASWIDRFARDVPENAHKLARAFWPGALTLVLKRDPSVPDVVTGGQDTVGLRVPSHPVAHALLVAFAGGIAAPSANRYGHVSPTAAEHVGHDFGATLPLILDGGAAPVGIESTIVDLSGEAPRLLRPGGIALAAIEQVLGGPLAMPDAAAPRAPGRRASHYAPRAQVKLMKRREMIEAVGSHKGRRLAALALEVPLPRLAPALQRVVPAVATKYGHALYAALRALDGAKPDVILVEQPPTLPAWIAINDRLARAAHGGSDDDEP
jgi:L-threonylcarbamoyladenylate synthase